MVRNLGRASCAFVVHLPIPGPLAPHPTSIAGPKPHQSQCGQGYSSGNSWQGSWHGEKQIREWSQCGINVGQIMMQVYDLLNLRVESKSRSRKGPLNVGIRSTFHDWYFLISIHPHQYIFFEHIVQGGEAVDCMMSKFYTVARLPWNWILQCIRRSGVA